MVGTPVELAVEEKGRADLLTANQKSRQFYNGHTSEEIENSDVIGLHGEKNTKD